MIGFKGWTGSVIGYEHQLRQANCQDKYRYAEVNLGGQIYQVGVVCDGCSEGTHSEVGAALLSEYIVREAVRLLAGGCEVAQLPEALYRASVAFLQNLSCQMLGPSASGDTLVNFVRDYLLATVLGFVIGPEQAVIFAAGDGSVMVNEVISVRDQANRPAYLAYALLKPSQLSQAAKTAFEVYPFETAVLERLAIWTDGFDPALADQTRSLGGPRSLQRKLNVWAKEKRFTDDATGLVLERQK